MSIPTTPPLRAEQIDTLEDVEVREHEVHIQLDDRHYRVRGLEKNLHSHQLRVNLLAERQELVHLGYTRSLQSQVACFLYQGDRQ